MEGINKFKAVVAAFVAAMTALWGWFGWLVVGWVFCMALDYITGTAVACKEGQWDSNVSKECLWNKLGCFVAVLVSGILDLVLGTIISNIPGIQLPFEYTVFFCPVVVTWYIIAEAGSIIENAGLLGAPIPEWLSKAIEVLSDKVELPVGEGDSEDGNE